MPLFWLSLSFLTGIIFGRIISPTLWIWFAVCVVVCLGFSLPRAKFWLITSHPGSVRLLVSRFNVRRLHLVLRLINKIRALRFGVSWILMILVILLGTIRYWSILPENRDDSLVNYNDLGDIVELEGIIIEFPDERDVYTNLIVQVDQIRLPGEIKDRAIRDKLVARVPPGGDWAYGDKVALAGYLVSPTDDETFSYRDYLSRRGIFSILTGSRGLRLAENQANPILARLFNLRKTARENIYQLYPDPEASLLVGILLGLERGIPEGLIKAYQKTGTAHIIAISGFNMTLLVGLSAALFTKRIGRLWGAILAILSILVYTILVGADAAVVRAAVMGGFGVIAAQLGRRQSGINSLFFVAALMTAAYPYVLWDIGFLLSFTATLGLVLFGESWPRAFYYWLRKRLSEPTAKKIAGPIGEYLLLTFAAQVMTLPVVVFYFQRFSVASIIVNPLILPVQPAIMIFGGLSLVSSLIWLPAGQLISIMVWPLVAYTNKMVNLFASFPGAELIIDWFSPVIIFIYYGCIIYLAYFQSKVLASLKKVSPFFAFSIITLITVQIWHLAWTAPDGLLHMYLFDVGRGDESGEGILIQSPVGRYVLINGGPSVNSLSENLGKRLVGEQLDYLIVAGVEESQIQAVEKIIPRYPPGSVLWAGETHGNRSSRYLYQSLLEKEVIPKRAVAGMVLDLSHGAYLQFLTVRPGGAVLLLEMGSFRALLPIGLDFEAIDTLRDGHLAANISVLMLAGSGYAPLNPPDWINDMQPQMVLLSVSPRDRTGLPDPELIESVQSYSLLRTDINGWIHLSTDGETMWTEVQNPIE